LTTLLTMSTSVLTTLRISSRCLLALTEILVVSLVATHVSLLIVVVPHSVVSHYSFPSVVRSLIPALKLSTRVPAVE